MSAEITEVPCSILHAEGRKAPPEGWDDTPEPEMPLEDLLILA
ncbi:hypothetical protein WMF45_07715 [Sorangium sp. So ce448]